MENTNETNGVEQPQNVETANPEIKYTQVVGPEIQNTELSKPEMPQAEIPLNDNHKIKRILNKKVSYMIAVPFVVIMAVLYSILSFSYLQNKNWNDLLKPIKLSVKNSVTLSDAIKIESYKYVGIYSEDLIAVSDGDTVGFIDKTGKSVIPLSFPILKEAQNYKPEQLDQYIKSNYYFSDGFLVFRDARGQYGVFDKNSQNIFDRTYDNILSVTSDKFIVKLNEKYGVVDKNKKIIIPIEHIRLNYIGSYFFDDASGKIYDDSGSLVFDKKAHFAVYPMYDKETKKTVLMIVDKIADASKIGKYFFKYNYYSMNNSPILKQSYSLFPTSISSGGYEPGIDGFYENGLLIVRDAEKGENGLVDDTGKFVVPMTSKYSIVSSFKNNIAPFYSLSENTKSGSPLPQALLNIKGEVVKASANVSYDVMGDSKVNFWMISSNVSHLKGVSDLNGKILFPMKYDSVEYLNNNRFLTYEKDPLGNYDYYKIFDAKNLQLTNNAHNGWADVTVADNLLIVKNNNGMYGLVDFNGNEVVKIKYSKIESLSNGMYLATYVDGTKYLILK